MNITYNEFGYTNKGESVGIYTLKNSIGSKAEIITYGGALRSWLVKSEGEYRDIVLGYDTIEDYEAQDKYMGAILGRFANRIGGGSFLLNGRVYSLAVNNGPNHLHGGISGFDKKVWQSEVCSHCLRLSYTSADGEEGYPGELKVTVEYALDDDNGLSVLYYAQSTEDTVVNLSNHTYFNLAGHNSGSVLSHSVRIYADSFTENNSDCLPTGRIINIKDTAFDFSKPKEIGRDINSGDMQLENCGGYDHNFILNKALGEFKLAAEAFSPDGKIALEVYTDQPGIQFYTGNFLDGKVKGKGGAQYLRRNAFCFETQGFPNSTAIEAFPTVVLKKGDKYIRKTVYKAVEK